MPNKCIFTQIYINADFSKGQYVDHREKLSRKKRWEQLDEDVQYTAKKLDDEVVNPSQIRAVIKTFKERLPEIFPGRNEVPKTLIFVNGGVKLTTEGSNVIESLKSLEAEGTEILSCGTCLDFYNLKDKLLVGEISNMYTIIEKMNSGNNTIVL
jgi:selenium metabolism protein YedF